MKSSTLTTIVAYALIAMFFLAVENRRRNHMARTFRTGKFDGGSQRVLATGIVAVEMGLIAGPVLNHFGIGRLAHEAIVGWTGVALMVGGIALRHWAGRTLGAYFTRTLRVQDNQPIVTEGPYQAIRHPGYTGALSMWVGALISTANWLTITIATPAIIGAYVYRIRCEEIMLTDAFGEQYQAYQAHTWKLIPFI
ncbi:MAG: isoprenylcysteine carboxylmethyltransferase family protein, partial [Anaerolineae bacterium]|nr:isoprenylcysteine carboxylmethyltransferase family protein [Anaerolineae bacterium]